MSTTTKRTRITGSENDATITYWDEDAGRDYEGAMVTRRFVVRNDGGYVFEVLDSGERKQVCGALYSTGDTLSWHPSRGPLKDLIRREWQARQRAERKARS